MWLQWLETGYVQHNNVAVQSSHLVNTCNLEDNLIPAFRVQSVGTDCHKGNWFEWSCESNTFWINMFLYTEIPDGCVKTYPT